MSARNTFAATRRSHEILRWIQDGEEVSIERVSDAFGIQYPQAREDLKLLEEIYKLPTKRVGRTKVWYWNGRNPHTLNIATAAALELGSVALDIFKDTAYGEAIEDIKLQCRKMVAKEQQPRLERLSSALHHRHTWLPYEPDLIIEHIEEVLDAIFLTKRLNLCYERADGEVSNYIVLPRRVIWYHGRLWLLATHKGANKLFDIAGIQEAEILREDEQSEGQSAKSDELLPVISDDPEEHFKDAFGIYAENYPTKTVRMEVRGAWANYLKRYRLHPSQVNKIKNGQLHVTLRLSVCPEFKSFLLGMIPDVTIRTPVALARDLHQRAAQWCDEQAT